MKPLKIGIIGPAWPLRGGLATFDELLCAALNQSDHKAEIISFSLQYPNFLFPGTTQYSDSPAPEGIPIESRINSVNPLNWIATGRALKKRKYDLIIIRYWLPFMGPALGTIARLAKRNKHTKIVSLVDNAIPHEKRFGDKLFSTYFLPACHAWLTMSKKVLADLDQFTTSPNRAFTEHPLYTSFGEPVAKKEARNQLKLAEDGKYLLFFGLIRHYKGLDLLLEAIADPRIRALNIKLIVAGEYYEDPTPYNEQIKRLNIADHVVLHTHFIPDNDVRWYFSACDLVTQTYHTATQSGVTKIALQFDKPSLVTNVGGLGEIILHNQSGYVVPPTVNDVADAIVDFYSNNREADFVAATQEEKKKYSWQVMVQSIQNLYEQIS
jgi:D-inositol-3-phosphate glycosyltransferase